MKPEDTGQKQAGRFVRGRSGNPAGRPRGARNTATLAAEVLLQGEAENLTRKCIELALGGDTIALRLCLERIYPVRRDRAVSFPLPPIGSPHDAADIAAGVVAAVAAGKLSPAEGLEIGKVLEIYVRGYKTAELDDRIARAEQLSDAELLRIVRNGRTESAGPRVITISSD